MSDNNAAPAREKKGRFVSLRIKLLIGFTLIFLVVFAFAFLWFYSFATEQAMSRIKQDLQDTVLAAAEGTNAEELVALSQDGEINDEGFSDDPRYDSQLDWLQTVHDVEPRAWPYNYVVGTTDEVPVIYVADLWYRYDQSKAVTFLEPKTSRGTSYRAFSGLVFNEGYHWEDWLDKRCVDDGWESMGMTAGWCEDFATFPLAAVTQEGFTTYTDEWGRWVSAYAPVTNADGEVVGAVGVDFEADYVDQVQRAIRDKVVVAFLATYGTLFVLIYLASGALTGPIRRLTTTAQAIGEGKYDQDLSAMLKDRMPDEIDTLAMVFQIMVDKVYQREQKLKQQVQELQIIVDEQKKQAAVEEIADSDFFRDLQGKARELRGRKRNEPATGD